MRVLVALIAFVAVAALNLLWWWWPNRPVEIAGWTSAPLQSVSFAPYRPGQSPLTRTFPTPDQIEEDLQAACRARSAPSGPIPTGENLEAVPQRAGKYGLKVWHGAWLNDNDKENLEQINLLIDHANRYKDTVERVIVGNEVLLRKDLTANQLRRYIRQVKQRVSQPVTYADVWEFWLRNPSLADEVDFITIHILPYWEDEPIGLDRREPDGKPTHREAHRRHLQEGPGALSRQEDRDRRDRLAERRPHALRRAAGPGRAGALLLDLPRHRRPREVRLQHRRSLRPVLEGPPGGHGRRRLGPARRPAPRQVRARQAGRRPSRTGAMLFTLSTLAGGLMLAGFVVHAPPGARQGRSPSSPSSPSSSRPATCRRPGSTCRAPSISRRWWASSSGRCCSALFSYALLRGIADSLTGRMADPSLYGARVREAWRAWRELPRFRIVQRADLMAQVLYLVLTVLCIFYLIVISIDWYDGVIRLSETFYRQIAIDGRYRDFPIWSFVIPSIVLMAWKTLTMLRTRAGVARRALWPRRCRSAGCWATTAARATCAWTGRSAASGRCCRKSCCRRC